VIIDALFRYILRPAVNRAPVVQVLVQQIHKRVYVVGDVSRLKRSSYELLILEALDPCSAILADHLDVPFILLITTGLGHFDPNPRPPSYLPAAVAPFTDHMLFHQRLINVLIKLWYASYSPFS